MKWTCVIFRFRTYDFNMRRSWYSIKYTSLPNHPWTKIDCCHRPERSKQGNVCIVSFSIFVVWILVLNDGTKKHMLERHTLLPTLSKVSDKATKHFCLHLIFVALFGI